MVQLNTTLSPSIVQAPIGPVTRGGTKATGSVTIAAGNAADTNTVTIIDAVGNTVTFEFDNNATVTPGNVSVTIGAANTDSAANLAAAVNVSILAVTATVSSNVVTLTQRHDGTAGNTTITVVGANLSKSDFTGGDNVGEVLILERIAGNGDVLGAISNLSDVNPLVLQVQQGDLNTLADYANTNVFVNGASVASITVAPNVTVPFVIPGPGVGGQGPGVAPSSEGNTGGPATRFIRFKVLNQDVAYGSLSLTYYNGGFERRKLYT